MLLQDDAQKAVGNATKAQKNHKSHGTDGIPEEAYKAIKNWITEPIAHMVNEIINGKQLPKI